MSIVVVFGFGNTDVSTMEGLHLRWLKLMIRGGKGVTSGPFLQCLGHGDSDH